MRYLGRKSELKLALREVRDRETGMALNAARARQSRRRWPARERRARRGPRTTIRPSTSTLPGEPVPRGSLHLITQIRRAIEDVFLGMGYEVYDGREVETRLAQLRRAQPARGAPVARPARTRSTSTRTRCCARTRRPSQIRAMQAQEPPIYIVSLGRCYRRDTLDATHTPVFHQVEGLAVDRGITLADLRGTIELVSRARSSAEREVRMRTSYFPFTEPSVEFDVICYLCDGAGLPRSASTRAGSRWAAPAWSTRTSSRTSATTRRSGTGFAFGLGIDADRDRCATASPTCGSSGRTTCA